MIISEDAGASWLWTCEQPETSLGYLYGVGPPPRDRFYALSPTEGLAFSDDGSCSWRRAGGALSSAGRERLLRRSQQPDRVLAVAATVDQTPATSARSRCSNRPTAARRSARRRFTRRRRGERRQRRDRAQQPDGRLHRHVHDAGPPSPPAALERRRPHLDGPRRRGGLGANEFRILTVDPDDANVLYLRVVAFGMESVAVTRDAGMTFAMPVTVPARSAAP